ILVTIGGSGCGKSTMLRAISGLDTPTQGKVVLDGTVIPAPHEKIGIVFQEPRLLPWLRVADNVGFGLEQYPKAQRRARVAGALARRGPAQERRGGPAGGPPPPARPCPRRGGCARASSPAAKPSASPLRARWCRGRRCFSSTSR